VIKESVLVRHSFPEKLQRRPRALRFAARHQPCPSAIHGAVKPKPVAAMLAISR
jgi:hypothetical protein